MATSRYASAPIVSMGKSYGTSRAATAIRAAVRAGALPCRATALRGGERIDTVAGDVYGDGRYWWIIAAASNVGWWLQCPPGTELLIPDLSQALNIAAAS